MTNHPSRGPRLTADIPSLHRLRIRSRTAAAVRTFFLGRGFLEVDTPVRIPAPALELHLDAPPSGRAWLRTSPELHMKRLVAAGCPRVFQLGPCFRESERGSRHNPEFTMLEWYRAGTDYRGILNDCRALLRAVALAVLGRTRFSYSGARIDLQARWMQIPVSVAFQRWAHWDPATSYDADRFDTTLVSQVEPALPRARPCVLFDYPAEAAALARLKPGNPLVAERWELYVGGMELANAYSELTDGAAQRARFEACAAARRAAGRAVYPLDEPFLQALEGGLPACGGIALGFDRLVMLLSNAQSIDEVRPFCPPIGACY